VKLTNWSSVESWVSVFKHSGILIFPFILKTDHEDNLSAMRPHPAAPLIK
jgi:hypothetical protein